MKKKLFVWLICSITSLSSVHAYSIDDQNGQYENFNDKVAAYIDSYQYTSSQVLNKFNDQYIWRGSYVEGEWKLVDRSYPDCERYYEYKDLPGYRFYYDRTVIFADNGQFYVTEPYVSQCLNLQSYENRKEFKNLIYNQAVKDNDYNIKSAGKAVVNYIYSKTGKVKDYLTPSGEDLPLQLLHAYYHSHLISAAKYKREKMKYEAKVRYLKKNHLRFTFNDIATGNNFMSQIDKDNENVEYILKRKNDTSFYYYNKDSKLNFLIRFFVVTLGHIDMLITPITSTIYLQKYECKY